MKMKLSDFDASWNRQDCTGWTLADSSLRGHVLFWSISPFVIFPPYKDLGQLSRIRKYYTVLTIINTIYPLIAFYQGYLKSTLKITNMNSSWRIKSVQCQVAQIFDSYTNPCQVVYLLHARFKRPEWT